MTGSAMIFDPHLTPFDLESLRGVYDAAAASPVDVIEACPSRKSYPRVAMMQSGQDWCDHNGPRSLDRSSKRSILPQGQVRARLIVI
jgi:hypothetical protein